MRRRNPILALAAILLILASCQKEKSVDTLGSNGSTGSSNGGNNGGNTSGTEVGTWKFINVHVSGTSTVETSDGTHNLKTVALMDYITENNGGTFKFDGSKITTTGITYTVNTVSKTYLYTDGVLEDTFDFPWSFTLPPYGSSGTYKKISSDSLYVDGGLVGTASSGGSVQSVGGGAKLKFEGDKMTMTIPADQVKYEFVQGVQVKTTAHVVTVFTLQKQ